MANVIRAGEYEKKYSMDKQETITVAIWAPTTQDPGPIKRNK